MKRAVVVEVGVFRRFFWPFQKQKRKGDLKQHPIFCLMSAQVKHAGDETSGISSPRQKTVCLKVVYQECIALDFETHLNPRLKTALGSVEWFRVQT